MSVAGISTISTSLTYFKVSLDCSKPWVEAEIDPRTGRRPTNFLTEERQVIIENVRGHELEYNLDTSGFLFQKHESQCKDFEDESTLTGVYFKESIELIKKVTGAKRVLLFNHTVRKNQPEVLNGLDRKCNPVAAVHVDQAPESAAKFVHAYISKELAPLLLKYRFQIINLWRPINHPAVDTPLALCDYRSIDWDKDFFEADWKSTDHLGNLKLLNVKYNPGHKWKYQRNMRPDEVVFIKCFDSRMDGKTAILTPHTAFVDPTTPKDAPLRESIEVRALVFYDDLPNEEPS